MPEQLGKYKLKICGHCLKDKKKLLKRLCNKYDVHPKVSLVIGRLKDKLQDSSSDFELNIVI